MPPAFARYILWVTMTHRPATTAKQGIRSGFLTVRRGRMTVIKRTLPGMGLMIITMLLIGLFPVGANGVARAGSTPTLALDPASGACGSQVTARGSSWPAGVALVFQRGSDNGP